VYNVAHPHEIIERHNLETVDFIDLTRNDERAGWWDDGVPVVVDGISGKFEPTEWAKNYARDNGMAFKPYLSSTAHDPPGVMTANEHDEFRFEASAMFGPIERAWHHVSQITVILARKGGTTYMMFEIPQERVGNDMFFGNDPDTGDTIRVPETYEWRNGRSYAHMILKPGSDAVNGSVITVDLTLVIGRDPPPERVPPRHFTQAAGLFGHPSARTTITLGDEGDDDFDRYDGVIRYSTPVPHQRGVWVGVKEVGSCYWPWNEEHSKMAHRMIGLFSGGYLHTTLVVNDMILCVSEERGVRYVPAPGRIPKYNMLEYLWMKLPDDAIDAGRVDAYIRRQEGSPYDKKLLWSLLPRQFWSYKKLLPHAEHFHERERWICTQLMVEALKAGSPDPGLWRVKSSVIKPDDMIGIVQAAFPRFTCDPPPIYQNAIVFPPQ
jgi:hypothetical protein